MARLRKLFLGFPQRIVRIVSYILPHAARLVHLCNHEKHLGVYQMLSISHRCTLVVILDNTRVLVEA